jgi:hypothetical protein
LAISDLNKLGENNNVLLRWIPAHKGHGGNEKADALAKRGSGNSYSTQVQLPVPKVIWKGALREDERSLEKAAAIPLQEGLAAKVRQVDF